MIEQLEEEWREIPGFSDYLISNTGLVFNLRTRRLMRTSRTSFGHAKISLCADRGPTRITRSVAVLVAEAFVEAPNFACDQLVVLDGDFSNLAAYNLAWRPRWFAWKYTRQLKGEIKHHYRNLVVRNVVTGFEYSSIVDACVAEGLLFDDVWRSTYTGQPVYPTGSIYEVIGPSGQIS